MSGISSAPLGDRVNGRFVLKAPLRHSGVVQAFLALDHQTGRDVALSLFDPACARPEAWAAFARVVAAAAGAGIEGLVLPKGVEPTPPAAPHCVIDPPVGRGLDRLREQDGPMPWERALAIGERIAAVLHSVQGATRSAHRALLPSRCVVMADDKVLVLDYGVAELELGGGQGESAYRAPEQRQASGDAKSDIFSLAVILFELISGKRPSTKMAPRLRSLVAVPPAVDALMSKALAQDPAQRHPDLGALRAAIRECLGLDPLAPEVPAQAKESPAVVVAPVAVAVAEPELVLPAVSPTRRPVEPAASPIRRPVEPPTERLHVEPPPLATPAKAQPRMAAREAPLDERPTMIMSASSRAPLDGAKAGGSGPMAAPVDRTEVMTRTGPRPVPMDRTEVLGRSVFKVPVDKTEVLARQPSVAAPVVPTLVLTESSVPVAAEQRSPARSVRRTLLVVNLIFVVLIVVGLLISASLP